MRTTPEAQYEILAGLFINYREDDSFADLLDTHDVAFPLAFSARAGILDRTPAMDVLVAAAFADLLDVLDLPDDGWTGLDELLAGQN